MKKFLICIVLLTISWAHGHSQKNLFLIGGNVGGMFSSNNIYDLNIKDNQSSTGGFSPSILIGTYGNNPGNYKTLFLEATPSILFYLKDKLLIGAEFNLLTERNKYESNLITKSISRTYFISPTIRYFFYQGFFCQFQYNIGKSIENINSNSLPIAGQTGFYTYNYSTKILSTISGIDLTAGYSIPLGTNVTTELGFSYLGNKNKFKYDNSSDSGTFNIKQNVGLIFVGIKYILKAKVVD
jgi:hypothetical protein